VTVEAARQQAFAEPSLPRSNGTPVFDAPWQARAHAIAVLSVEAAGREWDDFRRHLMAAIDDDDRRPYWDSWVLALEEFIAECGVAAKAGVT
jgi:hypothetical protein